MVATHNFWKICTFLLLLSLAEWTKARVDGGQSKSEDDGVKIDRLIEPVLPSTREEYSTECGGEVTVGVREFTYIDYRLENSEKEDEGQICVWVVKTAEPITSKLVLHVLNDTFGFDAPDGSDLTFHTIESSGQGFSAQAIGGTGTQWNITVDPLGIITFYPRSSPGTTKKIRAFRLALRRVQVDETYRFTSNSKFVRHTGFGSLKYPELGSNYEKNERSIFVITSPPNSTVENIELYRNYAHTEADRDYVIFFKADRGRGAPLREIIKLNGSSSARGPLSVLKSKVPTIILFYSDSSNNYNGFELDWQPVPNDDDSDIGSLNCGGNIELPLTPTLTYLSYKRFDPLQENERCLWTITADGSISAEAQLILIDDGEQPLTLYNSNEDKFSASNISGLENRWSVTLKPTAVLSLSAGSLGNRSTGFRVALFVTDYSSLTKFNTSSIEIVQNPRESLVYPLTGGNYSSNERAFIVLKLEKQEILEYYLDFMDIDQSSMTGYCFDALSIYEITGDGKTLNDSMTFCGDKPSGRLFPILTSDALVLIVFRSNESVNKRGFKIDWQPMPIPRDSSL